jgi:chromosome segregation ATPase
MWPMERVEQKLNQIAEQLTTVEAQLGKIEAQQTQILDLEGKIMTAQSDFSGDITALQSFFSDLTTQLTNIQTELANQGVTNVSGLDALVSQAQQLQPTIDALGSGQTPPATPPTS